MTLTNTVFSERSQTPNIQTGSIHRTDGESRLLVTRGLTHTESLPAQNETRFYPIVQEVYKEEGPHLILVASVET